jgi:hypothetical protein
MYVCMYVCVHVYIPFGWRGGWIQASGMACLIAVVVLYVCIHVCVYVYIPFEV